MICPNCKAEQQDGLAECQKCGVIFAKWQQKNIAAASPVQTAAAQPKSTLSQQSIIEIIANAALRSILAFVLAVAAWGMAVTTIDGFFIKFWHLSTNPPTIGKIFMLLAYAAIAALAAWGSFRLGKSAYCVMVRRRPASGTVVLFAAIAAIIALLFHFMFHFGQTFQGPSGAPHAPPKDSREACEGNTRDNFAWLYTAIHNYYKKNGYCPDELSVLVSMHYMGSIPVATTFQHNGSSAVQYMTTEEYETAKFTDTGGWAYVTSGTLKGLICVNCNHVDLRGMTWVSCVALGTKAINQSR